MGDIDAKKAYLKGLFTQYWLYMVVYTACRLDLFDHLRQRRNLEELASDCELDREALGLLLNALVAHDFLALHEGGYSLTPLGKFLTEGNAHSLKFACLNWGSEHMTAWQNLELSIREGGSAFEQVYGQPFFAWLETAGERAEAYQRAMGEYARDDYRGLCQLVDLSEHSSILDVGGGRGVLIRYIKAANPSLRCGLFDLEGVLANLSLEGIELTVGDFFEGIPRGYEAMVLSRVLHDWDDGEAEAILRNCHTALEGGGKLYELENCSDLISVDVSLLTLNMWAICRSRERSSGEYIKLATGCGFALVGIQPLNALQSILQFEKL